MFSFKKILKEMLKKLKKDIKKTYLFYILYLE
jgi:hypothetical protein